MNSDLSLNFENLRQFAAFADRGTLLKASEILHISQPTLTRAMKKVEESFGISLFNRTKNKIELNEVGLFAAVQVKKLLSECEKTVTDIQNYRQNLKTITVYSCAPAPLWSLLPRLAAKYPENTISSKLTNFDEILQAVKHGDCHIGILPYKSDDPELKDITYISEQLFVCVPKDSNLTKYSRLTFEQINGFNCILRDKIGFWNELCRKKMPSSRFLVQTDEFAFRELVKTSTLLCFTTDLANRDAVNNINNGLLKDRIVIPVSSSKANVTYHIITSKNTKF